MIKKNLLLLTLVPFLLVGCGNKDASSDNKEESSEQSSGEESSSEAPEAPVDEISLSLSNFKVTDVLPEPEITGLTAQGVHVAYSYHNRETGARIGDYVAGGEAGSIAAGSYTLKAAVTSSTYKPFELSTNFRVVNTVVVVPTLVVKDDVIAPDFEFDGETKIVEAAGVDTENVDVLTEESVLSESDAGVYSVKFALKDPENNCWADDWSSENKVLTWEIKKRDIVKHAFGYRIILENATNTYSSRSEETNLSLDRSLFAEDRTLRFQLRNEEGAWNDYISATYALDGEYEHASIAPNHKLTIDDFSEGGVKIVVGTPEDNWLLDVHYNITFVDAQSVTERVLAFDTVNTCASFNGLDISYTGASATKDYLARLATNGNGFDVWGITFKRVQTVKMKVHFEDDCTYGTFQAFLTKTDDYYDHADNINVTVNFYKEDYDESTWIDFDFSEKTFDAESVYYLKFWFTGDPLSTYTQFKEIMVIYSV